MKFETKYRICLHKNYFQVGYNLTSYIKYLIAFFGLAGGGLENTMVLGSVYVPVCYLVGRWWYTRGWAIAETEVGNKVNLFVRELRAKAKTVSDINKGDKKRYGNKRSCNR